MDSPRPGQGQVHAGTLQAHNVTGYLIVSCAKLFYKCCCFYYGIYSPGCQVEVGVDHSVVPAPWGEVHHSMVPAPWGEVYHSMVPVSWGEVHHSTVPAPWGDTRTGTTALVRRMCGPGCTECVLHVRTHSGCTECVLHVWTGNTPCFAATHAAAGRNERG